MGQCSRDKRAIQRENYKDLQRVSIENSAEPMLCAYEEITADWGKNQQWRLVVVTSRAHTSPGIVPIPTAQTGKHVHEALGKILTRDFLQ